GKSGPAPPRAASPATARPIPATRVRWAGSPLHRSNPARLTRAGFLPLGFLLQGGQQPERQEREQ
ncbi:hypothetical protein, partial [Escherichia coli]|uniref:hypothetical protein n=1 Tax=Escherichia coli TaxID=562 RepID=UPI0019D6DD30